VNSSRVSRLLRINRTVSDMAVAVAFYRDALDFRVVGQATLDGEAWSSLMGVAKGRGRSVTLRLGAQHMALVAFDPPGNPYPPRSGSTDLWFQHIAIAVSDMNAACARLRGHSFEPISRDGPQRLPPADGSVIAYKFRDPDGHPLELIQFPRNDSSARQEEPAVFLGIDHSAINVADIGSSVDFYTRTLGLSIASRSINSGRAQQRLDRAADDLVDVVSVQPADAGPPHVELLGYRTPTGLPMPPGMKASDILADQLVLQVENLAHLAGALRTEKMDIVSPGIVTMSKGRHAMLARDPTGHLLLFCA